MDLSTYVFLFLIYGLFFGVCHLSIYSAYNKRRKELDDIIQNSLDPIYAILDEIKKENESSKKQLSEIEKRLSKIERDSEDTKN